MYEDLVSELYDLAHEMEGKDYEAEVREIARIVTERSPGARSLLDAACGTGLHMRHFENFYSRVDGFDVSDFMLSQARQKNPRRHLIRADMQTVDMGRTYTVVTCMFSAIGYLRTIENLRRAVRTLSLHLDPGGVIVVEPWWFPPDAEMNKPAVTSRHHEDALVCRMTIGSREDTTYVADVHYLICRKGEIRHQGERHYIRVFDIADYRAAFVDAGMSFEYLTGAQFPDGVLSRGVLVGTKQCQARGKDGGRHDETAD